MRNQRRGVKRLALIAPIWCAAIAGITAWQDAADGKPFDLTALMIAAGITFAGGVIYLMCRMIFNFIDG